MDSRQLHFFRVILDSGSLGKAAEQLNMSQPALTKNLRRLEDELGLQLFERSSRGVRPTEYARALESYAQSVMVELGQALTEISALKAGTKGEVVIGAPPQLAGEVLVGSLVRLNHEFPGVRIRISTQSTNFIAGLLAGDYHFIVNLLLGVRRPEVRQKLLFNDRLVLIARRGHPISSMRIKSVRDLRRFSWVLPDHDNPHRQNIESFFESESMPIPDAAIACNSVPVIRSVVHNSDYIGIVSLLALPQSDFGKSGGLIVIETGSVLMRRPLGIMWRNNQVFPQAAKRLFSIIEESASEQPRLDATRRASITLSIRR
jgi:DNA-binding transcriptional LysR family regulator